MKFRSSKEMRRDYGGAYGAEITAPPSTGYIDDGRYALPARLEACRRIWREALAEEFERLSKRKWLHTATNTTYRGVNGAVMPETAPREYCDCFIVHDGRIVPLVLDTRPEVWSTPTGQVINRKVVAAAPVESNDPRIQ